MTPSLKSTPLEPPTAVAPVAMPSSLVPSTLRSRPSTVSVPAIVIFPDICPPAFGKAAFAVVVVEVNTPSLVAISTPSTVPPRVKLLPIFTLLDPSSTTAFDAGSVQNTSFVPAPKLTKLSELELDKTVVLESVSGVASVTVPIPTSKLPVPAAMIQ